MIISFYQELWSGHPKRVRYFVTLQSARHCRCRKVSRKTWFAMMDQILNNPMFEHTTFAVNHYNGGRVAVWTDEFKEC